MGSHSAQAQAIVLFLIAFVLLAGAFAAGGSVLWVILAILVFGLSVWRFASCKGLEEGGDKAGS